MELIEALAIRKEVRLLDESYKRSRKVQVPAALVADITGDAWWKHAPPGIAKPGIAGLVRALVVLQADIRNVTRVHGADVGRRLLDIALGPNPTWRVLFARLPPQRCLVVGETGTGKERVARLLARSLSAWRLERPEIMVRNIGSIPESLMEAELFGVAKGTATGVSERQGLFQSVPEGGAVVLDELDKAPLQVQIALLRVLESHEVVTVGTARPVRHEVHVIASTNKPIDELKNGAILPDLYHRLAGNIVALQPLRSLDLWKTADNVAEGIVDSYRDFELQVDPDGKRIQTWRYHAVQAVVGVVAEEMSGYPWPGNLRELANLLQSIMQLPPSEDEVRAACRAWRNGAPSTTETSAELPLPTDLTAHLRAIELDVVRRALLQHGTQKAAATALGIDQSRVSRVLTREAKK